MKSFINKGIHWLLRTAHKPTSCSDEERNRYLKKAKEVNSEIKHWLGDSNYEMIGLGQNCNASWYIKESGNKQSSYPFDWVFTTPEILLDILDDDFSAFVRKDLLIPHGMDAGNERYHETLYGHRNPASREADRDYLVRCIERWRTQIQAQKPILFLTIVLNESDKRKRWKEGFTKEFEMPTNQKLADFKPLITKLKSLNPNCKFLFIEQKTQEPFDLSALEKNEHTFWLNFSAIDKNTGVQYMHHVDDEVMKTLLEKVVETNRN
ncbi:MAG: DUF1796 family putative cysteine peptidase [Flavobacteriales bacterium]